MKIFNLTTAAVIFTAAAVFQNCNRVDSVCPELNQAVFPAKGPFDRLSEYNLFKQCNEDLNHLKPNDGVLPYDLNMPLFSDYAEKERFIYVPEGLPAKYNDRDAFEFQSGTILIKNFFYTFNKERKLIETRLLLKYETGWDAVTYVWRDDQEDADLIIEGRTLELDNPVETGERFSYKIPNTNQCKGCHSIDGQFTPIGPKARNLNRDLDYDNHNENQLRKWEETGILSGLPAEEILEEPFPRWDDPLIGSTEKRARSYLDVNCAHCHSQRGPANNTGLFLNYDQEDKFSLGICKISVAAGPGSCSLMYDITPGSAEASILVCRMESTEPEIRMPETGRALVHQEGVELIRKWINEMSGPPCE